MRVLYVARLFSGLETSLLRGEWAPTGVPTIYKFIERLDRTVDALHIILARKDGFTEWKETRVCERSVAGLRARVTVLPGAERFGRLPRRLSAPLREFAHLAAVWRAIRRFAPDLVYVDHGNIWQGGLVARFSRVPVVFRVMGVYPAMRAALNGGGVANRVLRWLYRSPFAAVVCSQDGSGAEAWLEQAIDPGVPRTLLINGIDPPPTNAAPTPAIASIPADSCVVGFVGKLEPAKGAMLFARAFLAARERQPGLHALIVGTGSERAAVAELIAAANAQASVTMIDRLAHAEVLAALRRVDIYVSLNRLGNLSNANLEVMRAGIATIVPSAQPETGVDVVTDTLFPPDTLWRIADADDLQGLVSAIVTLAADPMERRRRAAAIRTATESFTWSWDARLSAELAILEAVVRRRRPPGTYDLQEKREA